MICPNCGTKNTDEARFCESCGCKLNPPTPQVSSPFGEVAYKQPENGGMQNQNGRVQSPNGGMQNPNGRVQNPNGGMQNPNGGVPYPNGGMQAPNGGGRPPKPPKPPRKPLSTLAKLLIIEGVVLVAFVVLFYFAGTSLNDSKKVAKNYWEAKMSCNWSEVYSYLDLPDDDMLTEEEMQKAFSDTEAQTYSSYTVTDSMSEAINAYSDLADYFGVDVDSEQVTNGNNKYYTINYYKSGESGSSSDYVEVVYTGQKKLGLFKKWEVNSSDVIRRDAYISIPTGATLQLNGKEVDLSARGTESESGITEVYFPYLFAGRYEVVVSQEGRQTYSAIWDVSSSYEYSSVPKALTPDTDTMNTLYEQAYSDLQTILSNALSGADYTKKVSGLFASSAIDDGQSMYEDCKEDCSDGTETGTTAYKFSNVKASFEMNNADGYATITLSGNKALTQVHSRWWSSETYVEDEEDTFSVEMYYIYEDGKWKLSGTRDFSYLLD